MTEQIDVSKQFAINHYVGQAHLRARPNKIKKDAK